MSTSTPYSAIGAPNGRSSGRTRLKVSIVVNPADREHARRLVERLLAGAEQSLILPCEDDDEPAEITLIRPENLTAEQVGYAYGLDGESLLGGPGYWQAGWLVVGHERDLGDPYFVDLDQELLPGFHCHAWRGDLGSRAGCPVPGVLPGVGIRRTSDEAVLLTPERERISFGCHVNPRYRLGDLGDERSWY